MLQRYATPHHCFVWLAAFSLLWANASALRAQTTVTKSIKISGDLLRLAQTNAAQRGKNTPPPTGQQLSPLRQKTDLLQVVEGFVVIDAVAEGSSADLLADLEAKGLQKGARFGRRVSGLMPIANLSALERVQTLRFVRPAYKPLTNLGKAYTQGDGAQRSNVARRKYGVMGRGTTVGILSDSYNNLGGASKSVRDGDLPGEGNPQGDRTPVKVLEDYPEGGTDEGRAMAEIIHDIAFSSKLQFTTAFMGQASFAQGIINLANAGSTIIVDDVVYYDEPMFQDGIIAQAVNQVQERGIPYFSAAGNVNDNSYESEFRYGATKLLKNYDVGDIIGEYYLHDFDPGPGVDLFQEITIPPDGDIVLSFQWDQPFASACETCPGAESDLDIFLAMKDGDFGSMFSMLSGMEYNVGGDAVEILAAGAYQEEPETAYLVIGKRIERNMTTAERDKLKKLPTYMKYVNFGNATIEEYRTHSSTSYGHTNAAGAITIGAVRYDQTPTYGVYPPTRESFSSTGGTPILFNYQGKRISRTVRRKPDVLAPQGGNTTFFGEDYEGDGLPNFFGTSAAAPHAAAVAALMQEASKHQITGQQIKDILRNTALDMNDERTKGFDTGFDYATGYGMLQAEPAVKAAKALAPRAQVNAQPLANANVRGLQAYPNPTRNRLTVMLLEEGQDLSPISITLLDVTGKRLRSHQTEAGVPLDLDLSPLPAGVYILEAQSPHYRTQMRVMKE
ncbi:Por secretion system C-terminal sorting domain-containing protein [Catalinimonas alkaloidigena]|uniref:Por secretion system C-terminal sorting domain-containing protein n=1 Tax=Catalinimonas alkaloidigena TaxID=1075417 RepID=A0A1G9GAE7_9BACT|nr:S8 family serine peptidase [Catalinimonas alkaloidigena]SDK97659.1 Por secretion system C-terminal sorting domain-containing protein [Catalinimonas alkaloidigena]